MRGMTGALGAIMSAPPRTHMTVCHANVTSANVERRACKDQDCGIVASSHRLWLARKAKCAFVEGVLALTCGGT